MGVSRNSLLAQKVSHLHTWGKAPEQAACMHPAAKKETSETA